MSPPIKVRASAPGRFGIVGNPSDIYGGVVVSAAIGARNVVELTLGGVDRLPEDPTLWRAATVRYPLEGVAVNWNTTVPRSSGLAGSTALLAATLLGVLTLRGEAPDLGNVESISRFAELVRDLESEEAGVICGYQDAQIVVHGGVQRMDFRGKHPTHGGPLPELTELNPSTMPFLLITTGVQRLSGSVHGPIRERWLQGDPDVIRATDRIADLGREGADAFIREDWVTLGQAMTENHALVRDLGGSGDSIDQLVARCLTHGARSAKLAGAGLGGTVVALTDDPVALRTALTADGYTQFPPVATVPEPGLRGEVLL